MTKPADTLDYPHAELPVPGGLIEVASGVYWLRMPLPFALDHINLWLLQDGDGWTIVDCGYASDETRALWEKIFAALPGGGEIQRLIVTHYHPDHIGLAAWLCQRFGLTPWISLSEFLTAHAASSSTPGYDKDDLVALFRQHGLDETRLQAMSARGNVYHRFVPELPAAFRRIRDGDDISINHRSWRVIVGFGHAPEHSTLYCEELGVLISGDMVLPRISTNISVGAAEPEGDSLRLFLESLEHYRDLPADTLVLPSHGKVFRGLHTRIDQLNLHHQRRLAELTAACNEPRSATELLPVLFQRELDIHQVYFAMGEAIAHLNYLMHRSQLQRISGADGVYRFICTRR